MQKNPLIGHRGLPQFDKILPEHVEASVKLLQEKVDTLLRYYENFSEKVSWDSVMGPMADLEYDFQQGFGPVSHLIGVKNSPELRDAYEKVLPQIVQMGLELDQNKAIFSLLSELDQQTLNPTQKRIVTAKLRDAKNSGVGLEGEKKKRFGEISQRLSKLSTTFTNHVLDATKAYEIIITEKEVLSGLPQSSFDQAAQAYAQHQKEKIVADGKNGPWRIGLDMPSYLPVMKYAQNRELREKLYRARAALASDGEFDNSKLACEILQLRQEKAKLLGFHSFAELSVSSKMAPSVEDIYKFLKDIRKAAKVPSEKELSELNSYAKSSGLLNDEIKHWDFAYVSEKYREEKFEINAEEVKQYFQFPKVVQGLFQITKKAFGVDVRESTKSVVKWHPDVRFYEVWDEASNRQIAAFFLDPYSRPENKRGGAWMNECVGRRQTKNGWDIPVAYLICNGTPPVGDKPSLMTFAEVTTLFHEFGHGLQHMLTTVDLPQAAGIQGVEWDAVELPSQFMENWCYHKETLLGMTAHIETGKTLPDDMYKKLLVERTYLEAYATLRQVLFALTDMDLHHSYDPFGEASIFDIYRNVAKDTSVMQPLPEDRFLCAFSHIFAGGYAAGYYSYKWAEVLSADAFAAFEEKGLEDKNSVLEQGIKFRNTILASGGSKHPLDVFKEFRGREPKIDALLRHSGLSG